ncbi:hypothetical protein J6E39_04730 [bacterium]|nr:hypothetical protein [bacterium]
MKKENVELIQYITVFLLTSFSTAIFLYINMLVMSDDVPFATLVTALLLFYLSILIKLIVPIIGSIYVVKHFSNKYILNIYQSLKWSTVILIYAYGFDYIIGHYIIKDNAYTLLYGISPVYAVIYVFALIRMLVLKIKNR